MSEESEAVAASCCAACGIAEIDDIKLKDCDGCDLVKYCSDECKENHESEHEEQCKKRAAELRDERLFKQPESSHLGDCPICCLPLSLVQSKSTMMSCCSKVICRGCDHEIRENEMRLTPSCPFCREPMPSTEEEVDKQRMKRVEANDPVAMVQQGIDHHKKGEYQSSFENLSKAAELGDAEAHFRVSVLYRDGEGVDKDV